MAISSPPRDQASPLPSRTVDRTADLRAGTVLRRRPFEVHLPRERGCSAIARRLVERHFSFELGARDLADLKLITTQLVDDAYHEVQEAIRLRLQCRGSRFRVEVLNGVAGAAAEITASAPAS